MQSIGKEVEGVQAYKTQLADFLDFYGKQTPLRIFTSVPKTLLPNVDLPKDFKLVTVHTDGVLLLSDPLNTTAINAAKYIGWTGTERPEGHLWASIHLRTMLTRHDIKELAKRIGVKSEYLNLIQYQSPTARRPR